MIAQQDFRVHVAGTSGDVDHAARFHTAARHLATGGVRTGIAGGRPWAALTIAAAGPLDAAFAVGRYLERVVGQLTELLAWPDADEAWPAPATTPTPAAPGDDQFALAGDAPTSGERLRG